MSNGPSGRAEKTALRPKHRILAKLGPLVVKSNRRIVLSSDHRAIQLRQAIAAHLTAKGWEVVDIGAMRSESTDYPIHGAEAARLVASGHCRFGVILCGTGQGIMMAANKVQGIRCGVCTDTYSARMIRQHNDANMISIGARVVGEGLALDIVDTFLAARFETGRHAARVEMIEPVAKPGGHSVSDSDLNPIALKPSVESNNH